MDGISLDTALLFKYFRGLTTGEERKRVEDWMQISEENEKTVLQAARIFYISQTSERILSRNSIEAYSMYRTAAAAYGEFSSKHPASGSNPHGDCLL